MIIEKWSLLPTKDPQRIKIARSSVLLSAQVIEDKLILFVLEDKVEEKEERTVRFFSLGEEVTKGSRYIGTFSHPEINTPFHLFDITKKEEKTGSREEQFLKGNYPLRIADKKMIGRLIKKGFNSIEEVSKAPLASFTGMSAQSMMQLPEFLLKFSSESHGE